MLERKLEMYGKRHEKFSHTVLRRRIDEIKDKWDTEISRLARPVPDYKVVKKDIESVLGKT